MKNVINLNEIMSAVQSMSKASKLALVEEIMNMMNGESGSPAETCGQTVNSTYFTRPDCPHCRASGKMGFVTKRGFKCGSQRYYCKSCGRTFVPTTKTAFERSRKSSEVWKKFIEMTISCKSLVECSRECNICYQTAFTWRHKVLNAFRMHQSTIVMSGRVEMDEMLIPIKLGLITKDTLSIPNPLEEPGDFVDKVCSAVDDVYAAWAIESLILEISASKEFSKTYLAYAHYPELCLAWMDSLSGQYDFANDTYRKVFVNCPVSVSVYDSNNNRVAYIENRVITDVANGVSVYIDPNDQIVISLPPNEEYRIDMSATDDGKVTYTVEECDVETGSTKRVVSYPQVAVKSGDKMNGSVENIIETGHRHDHF